MIFIAYHPCYELELPRGHRFPMDKYPMLRKQLIYEGTFSNENFFLPKKIDRNIVEKVHNKNYVQKLLTRSLNESEIRRIGFPLNKKLIDREMTIAGGTLECCIKAFDNGISFNVAGGTHHAFSNRGEAFCLLNDQAIAAQYLINQYKLKKILIIDLDVHQGNGTAEIFRKNKKVFTFSMHGKKNYPFKKMKSDLDVGLLDGTKDQQYLNILNEKLNMIFDKIEPEFIFYLAGVDILKTDKLGRLSMTLEGCKLRDEIILNKCFEKKIPVQCSMGGGYSEELKIILEAHSNTFRIASKIF
ncbi:MAG: histone deacetylase [Flavobacteriales bacterium TMED96]|nr:MAG: histone deacetylase [Flavobacteriales bacterium TMED96]|tara:strand:+ start:4673 stop:5572 length:900 start_codon:yes stop_codon:yes gene_type:complete